MPNFKFVLTNVKLNDIMNIQQSRYARVKCRTDGELPARRKDILRCAYRIPL